MSIEAFAGCEKCVVIESSELKVVVTLNCGPRIIGLIHKGNGVNLMKTYPDELANPTGDSFKLYGGHRLWASPEIPGYTDDADNEPVEYSAADGWHTFTSVSKGAQLGKSISLRVEGCNVHLNHKLTNLAPETVHIAPWCLTVLDEGGMGLTPQPEFKAHTEELLPARPLVLWAYTNMSDPRVQWGRRLIRLQQTAGMKPFKYGAFVEQGFAGFYLSGSLFIKRFAADPDEEYPDFGCNFETFTREEMIEVESVGHMAYLETGESVSQSETWGVFRSDAPPADEDQAREWFDGFAGRVPAL